MTAQTERRSYTSGHFELQIDGHTSTAYLKSVDGGHWKGAPVGEAVGVDNLKVNHRSVLEVEPFSMEIGMAGAGDILRWIQNSWNKKYTRRSGVVRHADFNLVSTFEHEFFDALLSETTFPTLDGSSKEAGYLKFKLHPEYVKTSQPTGKQKIQGVHQPNQKMWIPSAFRLNIDHVKDIEYTNKIESFTIKQGLKVHYQGTERYPKIEPANISFPTLSCTIALEYARDLFKWWDKYTSHTSEPDTSLQRSGSIEFLTPDRKKTMFEIDLKFMDLKSVTMMPSTANNDQIKRVKFELVTHDMSLDFISGM